MIKTDRQLLLASTVFLLLYSFKDHKMKHIRKKIVRSIKKEIAIFRNSGYDKNRFLSVTEIASQDINIALTNMNLRHVESSKLNKVNPYELLKFIKQEMPEDYSVIGIPDKLLETYGIACDGINLTLSTKMYVNRLTELIKEETFDNLPVNRLDKSKQKEVA